MTEPSTEPSAAQKLLSIVGPGFVLCLLGANIYSIHKFKWTLTSWTSILILPGCVALLVAAILGVSMLRSRDEAPDPDQDSWPALFLKIPIGAAVGSILLFGCLPFWVNTWSASEPIALDAMLQGTSDAFVTHEDGTALGQDIRVGTDLHFEYQGHEFTIYQSEGGGPPLLGAEVRRGWLGWEFIVPR